MDCRNAHALMSREERLTPDEQTQLASHLQYCAACRDDQADPLGRALSQTMIEMALPPPDFTFKVLQRLPKESPLELARNDARQQQRRWSLIAASSTALLGVLALVGMSLQSVWDGTMLGLTAATIRAVAAAAAGPLVVAGASAVVLLLLLQIVLRRPTYGRAVGSAALACALLLVFGATIRVSDRANSENAAPGSTLFSPVQASQSSVGTIASLLGDITVAGNVDGDVGSLFGNVALAPGAQIKGDVLAGGGRVDAAPGQVAGSVRPSVGGLALGKALFQDDATQQPPGFVQALAALLGALVALALAGLVVMLWPDRTLRASRVLPMRPWVALGLGVLITVLLALLALPVLALLAVTVVGLLLVPLLLIALHLPYVQGLAAVGQALGERLTGTVTIASALWGVAAQLLLVLSLSLFAPVAGLVAFYLLASIGLGAQLLERRAAV